MSQSAGKELLHGVPERRRSRLLPTACLHPRHAVGIESYIDRQADALGSEHLDPAGDVRGRFYCSTADDDATYARLQQVLDDLSRPHAATDLQPGQAVGSHRLDQITVGELPVTRAVEVDAVQPLSAECAVSRMQRLRRDVVARLGVEVAVQQPYALTVAQVDGGQQAHQRSSRKLRSTLAPAWPDRSGWNCTPQ